MQRTQNYNLCQWAAEDRIMRSDFNADNQKIDAALSTMPRIVTGTYTGDGEEQRTFTLPFTPKAVWITDSIGDTYTAYHLTRHGGLAVTNGPCAYNGQEFITIVENGFLLTTQQDIFYNEYFFLPNEAERDYHYVAIG